MKRLALLAVSFLLAGMVGLVTLACGSPFAGGLQPTPIPPATPLPPNTPEPPPTVAPAPIQRMQLGAVQNHYITVKNLEGPSDDLGKLVTNSTLIVIGTVPNNDPETVRAQDHSPADIEVVGNGYNIQVERYLKGSGGDTIPVVQFTGLEFTDQGQTWQTRDSEKGLRLGKNNRYLFFLVENETLIGYWSGTAYPYKFLLSGGQARAESPVGDLDGAFPERTEADFISSVEAKIAASP